MARRISTLQEALTFDDVLMKPGHSEVLPSETQIGTRLTRSITLNIPIISAAMDTVTEARMSIAMAQAGGIGVIHRNLDPAMQADHVRQVKRFESGIVLNPVTISPDATLSAALALMERHSISGLPVVEGDAPGKLVGILTNRDVRFAENMDQPVRELMTHERLITINEDASKDQARKLFHQHRIEKLLIVDKDYRCIGLMTVKDIEKARLNPSANKDDRGRLRVAAATSTGPDGFERAERLIDAEVDVIIVDTAHGHSSRVLAQVTKVKKLSNGSRSLPATSPPPKAQKR